MDNKILQKFNEKYHCNLCNFVSCNKYNYEKHLLTDKHKKRSMDNDFLQKNATLFSCECGKNYKYKSGLIKHKKQCIKIENENKQIDNYRKKI